MLLPGELKNSDELIAYLRQELALRPDDMSSKQQERVAAGIVGLGVNDHFEQWTRTYPVLNRIFDMASDLEWSNVADSKDISSYWQAMGQLVDELEREVNASDAKP